MAENRIHWWMPPQRAADQESHRQVSFLELFYDLVYVVLISRLAHNLTEDLSVTGIGRFVFLWWRAGAGVLTTIGLWCLYFDFLSHRIPKATTGAVSLWAYLHLPWLKS